MPNQTPVPPSHSHHDAVQKLGEMIRDIRIAMFTTIDEQGNLHSRPMATQNAGFDGELWFFTDDTAPKSLQIQKSSRVNVAYAKPDEDCFVSVAGQAELVHDESKMRELWSPLHKNWFPQGLDTPRICLIRVKVEQAEYWDTRGTTKVHLFGFTKSLATSERYQQGRNEKLDLTG